MRKIFLKFVLAAAVVIQIIPLSSCNDIEENYRPDLYDEEISAVTDETAETPEISGSTVVVPVVSAVSQRADAAAYVDGIPEMTSFSEINDGRLAFTIKNVFSQGEYYTVSVIGEKRAGNSTGTYVNGEMYGDFRLVIAKDGAELDCLEIEVPYGERFLIMESVLGNLSYGCTVISNKRDFSTNGFPDIIQLDFYKVNELEVPQYGRYFAVFDGKLTELPVYENGIETAPRGTYLEPRGEGRMVQHLCVYTPSGKSLMVEKYEYIFDIEQRRLNKRKIDFLGWNVDN